MADCKEGNRRNQDGINLTEIVFEGKNESKFKSNIINGLCLEKNGKKMCWLIHKVLKS